MTCGMLRDDAPDSSGSREVDAFDGRMVNQRLDNGGSVGRRIRYDVYHAIGKSCIAERLANQIVDAGAKLGCLEYNSIAASERHGDRADTQNHRSIPRRDPQHDARRLANR